VHLYRNFALLIARRENVNKHKTLAYTGSIEVL